MFLSKRDNGYFFIQYFDPKQSKIRRISTKTKEKKEAEHFLLDFKARLIPQNQENENSTNKITLENFKVEYVQYVEGSKSKSYSRSINLSFKQLIESAGNILLQDLSPKMLDQFIVKRFSTSPSAAILYYRTLKAALSKAITWGYIYDNPLTKVKPPRKFKRTPEFISLEQFQVLLTYEQRQLFKDVFTFAFYTGMRLSEITHLKNSWIDIDRKMITVKNSDTFVTKSKKERVIPISNCICELITSKYIEFTNNENKYFFVGQNGRKLNEFYVSKQFKKLIRKSGIDERIHFHSLRHSFASRLVQKGASLFVVKELLGHEDITTTQIYSHLQTQNLIDAINVL